MTHFEIPHRRGVLGGPRAAGAVPGASARYPIKKWAAAAVPAAALFYLLLSGAEVATQRSLFMTVVVLIALMVDRGAVTSRTLAVAAMIVLMLASQGASELPDIGGAGVDYRPMNANDIGNKGLSVPT